MTERADHGLDVVAEDSLLLPWWSGVLATNAGEHRGGQCHVVWL